MLKSKNCIFFFLILILISFIFFILFNLNENFKNEKEYTINVNGEASRNLKPDTTSINFTVAETKKNLKQATDKVNSEINSLISNLGNLVEENSIKTLSYSIRPEYRYNKDTRIFLGFKVSQRISLEFPIENTNKIIDLISNERADYRELDNLNFFIKNKEEILKELEKESIINAKKRAKELEKNLNIKLGKLVSYNLVNDNQSPIYFAREKVSSLSSASLPTGLNEIKVQVNLTFIIK